MQLGKMHLVKEWFWFLYPTKELVVGRFEASKRASSLAVYQDAKALSESFNCNIFVVEPKTCVVLLEVDNGYFKLLDCNGNIGWIRCPAFFDYFELAKE
jgi:hypothetical protein